MSVLRHDTDLTHISWNMVLNEKDIKINYCVNYQQLPDIVTWWILVCVIKDYENNMKEVQLWITDRMGH